MEGLESPHTAQGSPNLQIHVAQQKQKGIQVFCILSKCPKLLSTREKQQYYLFCQLHLVLGPNHYRSALRLKILWEKEDRLSGCEAWQGLNAREVPTYPPDCQNNAQLWVLRGSISTQAEHSSSWIPAARWQARNQSPSLTWALIWGQILTWQLEVTGRGKENESICLHALSSSCHSMLCVRCFICRRLRRELLCVFIMSEKGTIWTFGFVSLNSKYTLPGLKRHIFPLIEEKDFQFPPLFHKFSLQFLAGAKLCLCCYFILYLKALGNQGLRRINSVFSVQRKWNVDVNSWQACGYEQPLNLDKTLMSKEHNLTHSRFCALNSHCLWMRQGRQHGRTVPAPGPESLPRTPRWGGFVESPTLVPHRASQSPGLSHMEFVSKPCSSSTLPVQNSCFLTESLSQIYCSPHLPLSFSSSKLCPKATDLSSSELLSYISTLPLFQAPSCQLCTHQCPFTLNHSIHIHPLPQPTSPAGGSAVLLVLIIDYWFCGLCCPSPKLWHPPSIHWHVLTAQPSQPNSSLPRTLQESCSDFCFWQTFSKSEHRLHLPKTSLAQLWRNWN